jgi:mevalonate kinase
VEDVQRLYERNPAQIGALFERIGEIAQTARAAIERGEAKALGSLMRENHALLQALTVSSPLLDRLVSVAEEAGAYGAKLSGGGRGGNMIALTSSDAMSAVAQALLGAGAKHAIQTTLA